MATSKKPRKPKASKAYVRAPAENPDTKKKPAWDAFDYIVANAERANQNPWIKKPDGQLVFAPDYQTLEQLLGVPLHFRASIRSGVPALALDVWLSYELRRAGFDKDTVWPRATHPRILPTAVAKLLRQLEKIKPSLADQLHDFVEQESSIKGVTSASASILGKLYLKQVDVIMSDWVTGPELLISTKRIDSSYAKNAPNRIEESYGDAKNLRLRHPLAALGFVFAARSDILSDKNRMTSEWLKDSISKLGREEDAYHATCFLLIDYPEELLVKEKPEDAQDDVEGDGIPEPGNQDDSEEDEDLDAVDSEPALPAAGDGAVVGGVGTTEDVKLIVGRLPTVKILLDEVPEQLSPARLLSTLIMRVLEASPVNMHVHARALRHAVSRRDVDDTPASALTAAPALTSAPCTCTRESGWQHASVRRR